MNRISNGFLFCHNDFSSSFITYGRSIIIILLWILWIEHHLNHQSFNRNCDHIHSKTSNQSQNADVIFVIIMSFTTITIRLILAISNDNTKNAYNLMVECVINEKQPKFLNNIESCSYVETMNHLLFRIIWFYQFLNRKYLVQWRMKGDIIESWLKLSRMLFLWNTPWEHLKQ